MEIQTIPELASRLKMPKNTLLVCTSSPSFPKHLLTKDSQHYYSVDEVKSWLKENIDKQELAESEVDPNKTLLTLQQCAQELGLAYNTVRTYTTGYADFPKPAVRIKSRPYFYKEDLEAWRRKKKRSSRLFTTHTSSDSGNKNLITRNEVANLLNISSQSVSTYALRKIKGTEEFPKPVSKVGRISYWDKEQILEWNRNRPRKGKKD
ncbi:helix-turn-helix transcriptional regulator [Dermabacteraceae bacterium CCM 9520]